MNFKKYRRLLCGKTTSKIMHETLSNKAGGLKNVDIQNKIIPLQCSWIRRLYNNSFHEWKLITLYLIQKSVGSSFEFHSNLLFESNKTKFFPSFCQEIILYWKKHLALVIEIPSCILSQYLWYNANIQVDKTSIQFSQLSEKYNSQLFNDNGSIKKWYEFKEEFDLHENSYFQ